MNNKDSGKQTQEFTTLLSKIDYLTQQLAKSKQKYKQLKLKVNFKSEDEDQIKLNQDKDQNFIGNNKSINQSFISEIQGQNQMELMIGHKKRKENQTLDQIRSINASNDSFSFNENDITNHQINISQNPPQINNNFADQSFNSELGSSDYMISMAPLAIDNPMLQNVEQEQEKQISQISVVSNTSEFSNIFIAALLSKLGLGDISQQRLEQLKRSVKQMRLQEQNNPQLQQVPESGTFLLNFKQFSEIDINDYYLSKITQWNRFLITDMQIGSQKKQAEIDRLFSIQWQNLQYVYIERQDNQIMNQNNQLIKKVDDLDLQFLTKYELNKNLKQLILKGQTMSLITARTLCEIKFLRLKELIIQFENSLSKQIVAVFIQTKFKKVNRNCNIRFYTPNGEIDTRFKPIYRRISFQRADSSDEQYGEPPY